MIIQFEVDFLPPSVNSCYPTGRNGRRFKSGKYKIFQILFADAVKKYKPKEPFKGDLYVEYNFYWSDKKRRDIGNLEKALSDTLTDLRFWLDDSQIQTLHMERHKGKNATVIKIMQLE